MNEIAKARQTIQKAFDEDADFKRVYIDNVARILMANMTISTKNKKKRDDIATQIIDRIFKS